MTDASYHAADGHLEDVIIEGNHGVTTEAGWTTASLDQGLELSSDVQKPVKNEDREAGVPGFKLEELINYVPQVEQRQGAVTQEGHGVNNDAGSSWTEKTVAVTQPQHTREDDVVVVEGDGVKQQSRMMGKRPREEIANDPEHPCDGRLNEASDCDAKIDEVDSDRDTPPRRTKRPRRSRSTTGNINTSSSRKNALSEGADASMTVGNKRGWTALHDAANKGEVEMVKFQLENGGVVDVNARVKTGYTALSIASNKGHVDIVDLLTQNGADANIPDQRGNPMLHRAAKNRRVKIMELLIEKGGADVNAENECGWTALRHASTHCHVEMMRLLVEKGADVNARGSCENGWSPLHRAAGSGKVELAELLLEKGALLNAQAEDGRTPFRVASDKGQLEMMHLLIEKGADVNAPAQYGWTALHRAAANGHTEAVKLLVEKGADVTLANQKGKTAARLAKEEDVKAILNAAAAAGGAAAAAAAPTNKLSTEEEAAGVKGLEERSMMPAGENVVGNEQQQQQCGGGTALHDAAANGKLEVVKQEIEKGAQLDARNTAGQTALWVASNRGHAEIVTLLIEKGANVNTCDQSGCTPLHRAVRKECVEMVKLLVKNGADEHATNKRGVTATNLARKKFRPVLTAAVRARKRSKNAKQKKQQQPQQQQQQQEPGCELDRLDEDGRTALGVAADKGHCEVVERLIEQGANVNLMDKRGNTPLMLAASNGRLRVAQVLIEKGADLDMISTKTGRTALMFAAIRRHLQLTQLLVDKGARLDTPNKKGNTALAVAERMRHADIAAVIAAALARRFSEEPKQQVSSSSPPPASTASATTHHTAATSQQQVDGATPSQLVGAEQELVEVALLGGVSGASQGGEEGMDVEVGAAATTTTASIGVGVVKAANELPPRPPTPVYPNVDVVAQLGLPLSIRLLQPDSTASGVGGYSSGVTYRLDADDKDDLTAFRSLGLTFNQVSGEVGGTPSALHLDSPLKLRVTAFNEFGNSRNHAELRLVVSSDLGLALRSNPALRSYESKVLNELACSVAELRDFFVGYPDALMQAANKCMAPHLGRGHKLGVVLTELL